MEEQSEEAVMTEIEDNSETTTQVEPVNTTEAEYLDEDKRSTLNITSSTLGVSDNSLMMTKLPRESPGKPLELPQYTCWI